MYRVKEMCQVLGVHRSNYYRLLKEPEGVRKKQDTILKLKIEQEFENNRRLYSAERISESLRKKAPPCGKTRARRLINELGLKPKRRTRYKNTTKSKHRKPYAQNLLNQDFTAYRPDQVWASDIAYIKNRRMNSLSGNRSRSV